MKVITERLGNTPQMIYEIYGHVLKELEQESVSLFNQSLESSGAIIGAGQQDIVLQTLQNQGFCRFCLKFML